MTQRTQKMIPWASGLALAVLAAVLALNAISNQSASADSQGRDLFITWAPPADSVEQGFHGSTTPRMTAEARTTNLLDGSIELKLLGPLNTAYWRSDVPTENGQVVIQKSVNTLGVVPGTRDVSMKIEDDLDGYSSGTSFTVIAIFRDVGGAPLSTKTATLVKP